MFVDIPSPSTDEFSPTTNFRAVGGRRKKSAAVLPGGSCGIFFKRCSYYSLYRFSELSGFDVMLKRGFIYCWAHARVTWTFLVYFQDLATLTSAVLLLHFCAWLDDDGKIKICLSQRLLACWPLFPSSFAIRDQYPSPFPGNAPSN